MKKLLSIFIFVLLTNLIAAQVTKTINVTTAGSLSMLLSVIDKSTIADLTITGNINAQDFVTMRDAMPLLVNLNLKDANIVAYNGTGGTNPYQNSYPANQLPEFSFWQYLTNSYISPLINIKLPNNINSIGHSAFRNCTNLKKIICSNPTPPTLGQLVFVVGDMSASLPPFTVYVPIGSVPTYKAATGWSGIAGIFEYILKVTTMPVTTITLSTATLNASIDLIIDTPVTAYGFCWNTTGSPTIADTKVDNGATASLGAYSNNISDLAQATKYFVKAYATDGERTVYGSEVSFTTASVPDAAGVISGAVSVCQGQNTVTYSVPAITYATSYTWTLPTGATGTSSTNSITVNYDKTSASGNITVKGHNEWGDGTVSTLAIAANLLPVNAGVISGNTSVCQGESSVTYTVPAIDNATSYIWTLPTGATGTSTTNNISVNYAKTSVSGNITVKGHNDCGDGVVSTMPIIINQLPEIVGTDKTIVCGGLTQLNTATTNYTENGTLKYKWTPATGLNNDSIANPTATVTSDITYTVTVTTPNGCTASDDIKVTVNPLTAITGDDKTIVCGGTAQLNSVTTNYTGTGTLKYKWTPATGLNNDSIANPTATVTSDITYTVTVTTPNGCTATDDVKVTVNPLTANAGVDKTIICGGTVQLNSVTTNYTGTGTLKYKWIPATGLNNDSIANPTATVINNITYTVTVKTPNGCTTTDEVSIIIIPMTKPEIGMVGVSSNNKNLIAWNKPVSAGIESYYIYRETNVTNVYEKIGTVSYDSLSIYIDNQSLPDVQANKYKLSIFDRHGLESPQSNYHKTMHLAINKGMGTTWNLSWEAYEGFVVSTYNIYRGTTLSNLTLLGSTSGGNTQYNDLNAPSGNVYYQLEVISPNSVNPTKVLSSQKTKAEENVLSNSLISYSSSRSNIATNVISGINELGENNKINIYPNPVKNELKIDFEGGSTFEILNLIGQVIYNGNLIKNTIVQTSNLSSGVYLIKFKTGKTFEYKKIIKE